MLDDPIHDDEANSYYLRNKRLYEYSRSLVEVIPEPKRGTYENAVTPVYFRAYYCLSSLAKLDQPGDFQAVRAIARTLFELYLDLVFLKSNPNSYKKYHAYNKLGWMKSAIELADFIQENPAESHDVRYFGELKLATDPQKLDECKTMLMDLYGRTERQVKNLAGAVPSNWTGVPQFDRIKQADLRFLEYFKTEVCQSNWYVHGGAVGVGGRTPEMFASVWARGHDLSFRLMGNMTYSTFQELDLLKTVPNLETTLKSFGTP